MKRKWIKIVLWVVSVILFAVLIVSVVKIYGKNKCKAIQIIINTSENNTFLTEQDVRTYINSYNNSLVGTNLSDIDTEKIECLVNGHPYVLKSKVYTTIKGILKIEITQRLPIARIQNMFDEIYYLSDDGRMMPVPEKKSARVVLVTGKIPNIYNNVINLDIDSAEIMKDSAHFMTTLYNVYKMTRFINKNDFFKAQIQQIVVDSVENFELLPEVGKHIIIFGDETDMEQKFEQLELFYNKSIFIEGWDKYDTINVKYKNQIICSKINL